MTDQELLRLAALAAGHELKYSNEWPGGGCLMRRVVPESEHPGSKWVPWRPLNDDGDALCLAVKLGLIIYHTVGDGTWKVSVIHQSDKWIISVREPWGNDKFAATRRAIVRIAAEIGPCMEEGST